TVRDVSHAQLSLYSTSSNVVDSRTAWPTRVDTVAFTLRRAWGAYHTTYSVDTAFALPAPRACDWPRSTSFTARKRPAPTTTSSSPSTRTTSGTCACSTR